MLFPSGNPFKCQEEVLYLQPLIPPRRFDIFSPLTGGCSEGLGAFCFFFKQQHSPKKETFLLKVGIEPPSTPLLGFQGSRGSRKMKKKCVFGGTVRKHRRVLHCPVASADETSRDARAPG